MAGKGWHCLCAVVLLLWLALGLPPRGFEADAPAASAGMSMVPDCGSLDAPGMDASCPPAWCFLCPALLPADLVLPDGRGMVVPIITDERGAGLNVRPRPPPPRLLHHA